MEEETLGEAEINHVPRVPRRETDVFLKESRDMEAARTDCFECDVRKHFLVIAHKKKNGFLGCGYKTTHRKRELRHVKNLLLSKTDGSRWNLAELPVKTVETTTVTKSNIVTWGRLSTQ